MRVAIVCHLVGVLVRLFGLMLGAPAAVAAWYREWPDAASFAATGVVTVATGHLMRRAGGATAEASVERMRRTEGLAVVSLTWLLIAHFAAAPFVFAGMPPVDALFEAMSGLTTTGATTIRDFADYGRGIFFWRALAHWVGGMGVIALFVAVLPRLAIGGRQLFFAEAPAVTDEKLTPQIRKTAMALWSLYAGLTAAQVILLVMTGMPLFDAVANSMATLAAGGFSPHPASIAGYQSAAAEWIIAVFMFLAGANFAVQYRVLRGHRAALLHDEEFRAYAGIVLVASILVAVALLRSGMDLAGAVRHGVFQVLSILTTTGFASVDFQLWTDQAKIVLLLLMFIGGCAGSAGGGPKVVRHLLMARYTLRELKRTLHPRAVLPVKLGGRVVPDALMREVVVFMLFYMLTFAVVAGAVVALGAEMITGITATIACLGNIGPGFNGVGPMANYADLHPLSKLLLTLAMWIGRLEVLTVLVLFRWELWRDARWGVE